MGIDRHEWEHRNYKSGRAAAAPAPLADDDAGELAVDASLGDASLQPEPSKQAPTQPVTSKTVIAKTKAKAAPKESSKGASKPAAKTDAKAKSGAKSGGKRSARG